MGHLPSLPARPCRVVASALAVGAVLLGSSARHAPAQEAPPAPALDPAELADRFLGPVESYGGPGHVIVLIPRVAPGTATATGEALAGRHGAELAAVWPIVALDETCFVLRLDDGADAEAASERVEAEDGVLLAYPIQEFDVVPGQTSADPEEPDGEVDPDAPFAGEPLLAAQDALRAMRVDAAHAHVTGRGARVALIDTGVALDHPDLAGQPIEWRDYVRSDATALAPERHGTAMAALIAADARNGVGMVGVAPDATVLALRGCWEDDEGRGRCNTFSLALALDYAVSDGAPVVNLSLEGPSDPLLEALVGRAQEGGAVVLASKGKAEFPSGLPGVVAVAAEDGGGAGADPEIRAPGVEVLGAEPEGGYDFFTGSSVATAHASGVAALLWSGDPDASAEAIREALLDGGPTLDACRSLDVLPVGPDCP